MIRNPWTFLVKRCPATTRLLILPLVLLGFVGFFINSHLSFLRSFDVCFPKTNIVFLKTHKCAGSSIQNILMRYGYAHRLTFVLPQTGNYLGHPTPFSRTMLKTPLFPSYNILAHHTRLDYNEIRSLMPADSIYITIVRNPIELFESAYSYYGFNHLLGGSLQNFSANIPYMSNDSLHKRIINAKLGSNQMMFDLGADPTIFNDEILIRQYIDKLDSWFDLVLVAERMDESLVLLRHLMCWETEDVITFKLNARDPKFKSELNAREKDALGHLNHADVLLYDHFLLRFERAIDDFGRDQMAAEVEHLRSRTQAWYEFCIEGEQLHAKPSSKPKYYFNPKVMVFKSNTENNSTCKFMTMEELPYTDILRQDQETRYNKKHSYPPGYAGVLHHPIPR